jgi:AhpD family alkylhydroperoxidase
MKRATQRLALDRLLTFNRIHPMATSTLDRANEVRETAKNAFGFVPNLVDEMADHNPAVAQVYLAANGAIEDGVLSPAEQQTVILAISAYNDCHYCTKAHAAVGKQTGLPEETINTILASGLPDDDRLAALVRATRRTLGKRGWLSDDDLAELESWGLGRDAIYEIVGFIGIKTISNFVNHIAGTEVDPQFQ